VEQEGQAFREKIDAWPTEHQVIAADKPPTQLTRLGVGVYHIQD